MSFRPPDVQHAEGGAQASSIPRRALDERKVEVSL
jgi:hypothetical protein